MKNTKDMMKVFEELIVEHRRFSEICEELLTCIQSAVRGSIIIVVGPTGVGKTRLKEYVTHLLREHLTRHPNLRLSVPLLLEAKRPEGAEFNWKAFFDQALRRLGEPSLEHKVNLDEVVAKLRLESRTVTYRLLTTPELRELYEQALDLQRPIATMIDEAQSMGYCSSDERRMANLDVIKGLSNSGKTVYVLFATYEARNLLRRNGQLARRVHLIDFNRYGDSDSDRSELLSVIEEVAKHVGFKVHAGVRRDWKYFYNHSLGCTGILVQWLSRALQQSLRKRRAVITRKDLEATRLSNLVLETIATEIKTFEEAHQSTGGFDASSFLMSQPNGEEKKESAPRNPSERGRKRPGARDPFRDHVGPDSHDEGSRDSV